MDSHIEPGDEARSAHAAGQKQHDASHSQEASTQADILGEALPVGAARAYQSLRQSRLASRTKRDSSREEISINAQLLTRAGFVDKLMAGVYSYLPLGQRVLANIEAVIRQEMEGIGSQEILLPALQPREPWDKTGRWVAMDVLYKIQGATGRELALGPTHEEIVTPLIGGSIRSYRDLPMSVFQIQTKFRNEERPKSGLLRGREFRMKDMYSFHASMEDLDAYYELVQKAYQKVFHRCGLGEVTHLTYASGGNFCKYSHEYQTLTPHGEDHIFFSPERDVAVNREIIDEMRRLPEWQGVDLTESKAIEVGNIFKLGTRFSDAFNLSFQGQHGSRLPVYMGCYGIGSTRLMGAIVEIHHDDKGIIWPAEIAPFSLHLLSLTKTAAENEAVERLYLQLSRAGHCVLFDDRNISAGDKFHESDLIGIPNRVIASSRTLASDSVEVRSRSTQQSKIVSIGELLNTLPRQPAF